MPLLICRPPGCRKPLLIWSAVWLHGQHANELLIASSSAAGGVGRPTLASDCRRHPPPLARRPRSVQCCRSGSWFDPSRVVRVGPPGVFVLALSAQAMGSYADYRAGHQPHTPAAVCRDFCGRAQSVCPDADSELRANDAGLAGPSLTHGLKAGFRHYRRPCVPQALALS